MALLYMMPRKPETPQKNAFGPPTSHHLQNELKMLEPQNYTHLEVNLHDL